MAVLLVGKRCYDPAMKATGCFFLIIFGWIPLGAQTDETIFREFQFDFSTPGARANAMGRAFVGLSDEATAAYNNPAGLSILEAPEFSVEFRRTHARFDALTDNARFSLLDGMTQNTTTDLESATFSSFSYSRGQYNFSIFFVNHLDYQRPEVDETSFWERNDDDDFYTFTYINQHAVRQIAIDSHGLSISRKFGKWSLGVSLGLSRLNVDYRYRTFLSSDDFPFADTVRSEARHDSLKPTYVLGSLYQIHPRLKLALSLKRQPRFLYKETIITKAFPEETALPVSFKVPDSYQIGLAYQPNDFWTLVLEGDWVQYKQLTGENFSILSAVDVGRGQDLFQFQKGDYRNSNHPEFHMGIEYLLPRGKNIFAFRAGAFSDNDHKTRFEGVPNGEEDIRIFDIQDFVFNTGSRSGEIGRTVGIGYVRSNKIQLDLALVDSERFRWLVSSFLYRF